MADAVFKTGRKKGFTTVYRTVAQDKRLSLKARGLFLLMQSLPDDWNYTISGLATQAGVGKDQIRSGLAELLRVGYLVKEQSHDAAGKFSGNVFILQEDAPPLSGNPTTVFPTTGKPSTENPTQQNNILTNTPIAPKGGEQLALFDQFWKAYPRKKYKERARKAWAKINPNQDLLRKMMDSLEREKKTDQWTRDSGNYIPHPATWLNGRCWEDEEDTAKGEERCPRYVRTEIIDGEERDIYE